ncbi:macrolide transporter ATP-binding /permease protein [Gloeobacter kilaueensis JS1]|uniref:Macrolide transporter ATP-binding /permease protein n=2 Tax=Gloeobacter TaxID=33071 RepID=U5QS88_GLOK1|nr:macrolide transporter ATP-binding /permease protein [Gloeobacter kilaueensis JS1]
MSVLDLWHGLRYLKRNWSYSMAIVLTLAVAIGANTSVFSAFYTALLKPLPYVDSQQLVIVRETDGGQPVSVSYPNYLDWRGLAHSFSNLSGYALFQAALKDKEKVVPLIGANVDPAFFQTLGVTPRLGRTFNEREDRLGLRVVILSDRAWRQWFAADPGILGRTASLGGQPTTIIGVMPPGFAFPKIADYWIPLGVLVQQSQHLKDSSNFLDRNNRLQLIGIARLRAGTSILSARKEMQGIREQLAKEYPRENKDYGVILLPLREYMNANSSSSLNLLAIAVFLLLMLACINVANLSSAQLITRNREIAIRSALGATQIALLKQLALEGSLLTTASLVGGVVLALGLEGLSRAALPSMQYTLFSWDWPVIVFVTAICFVCSVSAGGLPTLFLTRGLASIPSIKDTQPGTRPIIRRVLEGFVSLQMALALVLLCTAATVGGALWALQSVKPGFQTQSLLSIQTTLDSARYKAAESRKTFSDTVLSKLELQPGVAVSAWTTALPLSGISSYPKVEKIAGRSILQPFTVDYASVSERYFEAMGIPLLAGRVFNKVDSSKSMQVAVINDVFARKYFSNVDPIGQRVKLEIADGWLEIVGVVASVYQRSLAERPGPQLYRPYSQDQWEGVAVVLRTYVNPESLAPAANKTLLGEDPELGIVILSGKQLLEKNLSQARTLTLALATFAFAAIVLSGLGVYGQVTLRISAQTREIGVRLALGATPEAIVRKIIARTLVTVTIGIALGFCLYLLVFSIITSAVIGLQQNSLWLNALLSVALLVVAVIASWLPARSAAALDPLEALRYE